ncbi:phage tail tube protein [Lacunimicrobium album]
MAKLYNEDVELTFDGAEICFETFDPPETTQDGVDDHCITDTHRTQRAGKAQHGNASLTFMFDPSEEDHAAIEAASDDGEDHVIVYKLLGVGQYTYTGFVGNFKLGEVAENGNVKATVQMKVNSKVYAAEVVEGQSVVEAPVVQPVVEPVVAQEATDE